MESGQFPSGGVVHCDVRMEQAVRTVLLMSPSCEVPDSFRLFEHLRVA